MPGPPRPHDAVPARAGDRTLPFPHDPAPLAASLGGERLVVTYRLAGDEAAARAAVRRIALEQTVELPDDLVPDGPIRDAIVGRLERLRRVEADEAAAPSRHAPPAAPAAAPAAAPGGESWEARISFAAESGAGELTQLLNLVFGNISLLPSICVEGLDLPPALLARFRGPRFGRDGLREAVGAAAVAIGGRPPRPLLCTALKPMGLSATELATVAHRMARGGIDVIKDDHGLTDQSSAPFDERVARCAEAVARANDETGGRAIYVAHVSADGPATHERAHRAKALGAGGLMVCPGLCGHATMRALAADDALALPIVAHPAFQGTFVTRPTEGIAHGVLFGTLARLAGADATVFPNFGGRFGFTRDECVAIARAASEPLGALRPAFPTPGGGIELDTIPGFAGAYGGEVMYLVGGSLYRRGADLEENCRHFRMLVVGH